MKREILFRVYVKLNEEGKEFYNNQSKFIESVIHNVEYLSLLHNQCVIHDENNESVLTIFKDYCEVCELMQFTGLLDKNGVKIFENDKTNYGNIIFKYGCFGINGNNGFVEISNWNLSHIEIIGNTYE